MSMKYPSSPSFSRLVSRSMPKGLGVRLKITLKSVSGHTFLSSHPITARRSPSRRISAGWLGQYTLFSCSRPSRVTLTDTSFSAAALNFSVFSG